MCWLLLMLAAVLGVFLFAVKAELGQPCRRYGSKVAALRQTFSEYGLIKFRVLVECRWLQQLAEIPEVTEVPAFSSEADAALDQLAVNFSVQDALAVKKVICTQATCTPHHVGH